MIKRSDMIIMNIGKGYNLEITKEMVENSIDSFIDTSVVMNLEQVLKDYGDDNFVEAFYKERIVGKVESVKIIGDDVVAQVMWYNNAFIRDKYDNWLIDLSEDKTSFKFRGAEIFK